MKLARRFKTERSESLKSFSKYNGYIYYSESFPPVASERCYVPSSYLDFELNRNLDPLAERGYKFVDILKALITKLNYSWNKQMNKTSNKLRAYLSFTPNLRF